MMRHVEDAGEATPKPRKGNSTARISPETFRQAKFTNAREDDDDTTETLERFDQRSSVGIEPHCDTG
jgi:hypothetical protein